MLDHSCPTLPSHWYYDPDQYARELRAVWQRSWLCLGRESDWAVPGAWRAWSIGDQRVFGVRQRDGGLRAFHNTCRHRGSELCRGDSGRFPAGRIVCPYHAWAYDLDGRLLSTPRRVETPDFDPADFGLYEVPLECWGGFVFVHVDEAPRLSLTEALGAEGRAVEAWPLRSLAVAHRETHEVACNWKIFWENFSECLHCPGVHPALGRLVPLYGTGFTSADDLAAIGHGDRAAGLRGLREGAVTWADGGSTGLPELAGLGERERSAGMTFCTLWPSVFLIAHVDYVRSVQVMPMGPERTRLEVTWLLEPETLASGPVDMDRLTAFSRRVVMEDAAICETNQRGLRSNRHRQGVLLPQEYDVRAFDDWVRQRLGEEFPA